MTSEATRRGTVIHAYLQDLEALGFVIIDEGSEISPAIIAHLDDRVELRIIGNHGRVTRVTADDVIAEAVRKPACVAPVSDFRAGARRPGQRLPPPVPPWARRR